MPLIFFKVTSFCGIILVKNIEVSVTSSLQLKKLYAMSLKLKSEFNMYYRCIHFYYSQTGALVLDPALLPRTFFILIHQTSFNPVVVARTLPCIQRSSFILFARDLHEVSLGHWPSKKTIKLDFCNKIDRDQPFK